MRSSIRVHLIAGYISALILLMLAWAVATASTATLRASYAHTVNNIDTLSTLIVQGSKLRVDEETGLRGYLLTGKKEFLQPYTDARKGLSSLRLHIYALSATEPGMITALHTRQSLINKWESWAQNILRHPSTIHLGSDAFIAQQRYGKLLFDRYRAATAHIIDYLDAQRQQELEQSFGLVERMNALFMTIFAFALGATVFLAWRTMQIVARPLENLERAATGIGNGELNRPITTSGSREFVGLAASMEWMRQQISVQRAEAATREERFRALFENASDLVFVIDSSGIITYTSSSSLHILGYTTEEVQGRPIAEIVHPADLAREGVYDHFVKAKGNGLPTECRLHHKAGFWRTVEVVSSDCLDHPAVRGIVVNARDVSERKRIEEELRGNEQLLRTVITNAPVGIFALSATGIIILSEGRSLQGGERLPDEAVGQSIFEIFRDIPEIHLDIRRALSGEALITHSQIAGKALETRYTPLHDEEGTVNGVIGVSTDVTERTQAEVALRASQEELARAREDVLEATRQKAAALEQANRELARSNDELQQFAYVASHDLQEPLRTVASYTQLLRRRYAGKLDSDADEFISYAVDGASRMQSLINDLLAYSRVGTRDGEFALTDCNDVIDRTRNSLRATIQETGARIETTALPTVYGDPSQLGQLFQNLISNALKFSREEEPTVKISAQAQGADWLFAVQDNGIGLDPAYAERIFVIFQRLHTRTEYAGTGIGLAICKKIVERHGGRIWVESQPGQGATFYFTLPALQEQKRAS